MTQFREQWFLDIDTQGFYRDEMPAKACPTKALAFHPPGGHSRRVLIGGYDGSIRIYDTDAPDDCGEPMTSYVMLPPLRLGVDDRREGQVLELVGTLSVDSGPVDWFLLVAPSMAELAHNPETLARGVWTAGRNRVRRPRSRGGAACVKLQGKGYQWTMENVVAKIKRTGRQREML